MTTEIDAGKIIEQRTFGCENFTYEELYDKIIQKTPLLIEDVEEFFIDGRGRYINQKEENATFYENNRTIHGKIQWSISTAEEIENVVRTGQSFTFLGRNKIKVLEAKVDKENRNVRNGLEVESGTIVDIDKDSLVVKARSEFVRNKKVKIKSENLSGFEFCSAHKINIGEKLT